MPAEIRQPLAVQYTLPGQRPYLGTLHELPDQVLASDFARGLASAAHPNGPIRTYREARHAVRCARHLARYLYETGFTGSLSELTPAQITPYWLEFGFTFERHSRITLNGFHSHGGILHAGIQAHLDGRPINQQAGSTPHRPYSDGEWQHISQAARTDIDTAWQDHREALAAAERGSDPITHGITRDNLACLIRRTGPLPAYAILAMIPGARESIRATVLDLRDALFPTGYTALAYNLRLAMLTGAVPDGIDALVVPDFTHTGPATGLLSYRKGRTAREALNLRGPAVRLLDQWLTHSAALREHAGELSDCMWINYNGLAFSGHPRTPWQRIRWAKAVGLTDDNGQPMPPHGGRIRTTYHHRRDRSTWTGRTTIDPNHTPAVEGDHYLHHHTPAQVAAIEGIVEDAQRDIRRKAAPPVIATSQDAAGFAVDFPRLVADAGLDSDAIQQLLAGEQDVFVASCAGLYNSPHAPAGTACPARPWVCLLCPLAVFTPRHLPNLLRLQRYFADQERHMTNAQFLAIFGPYADRLDTDLLPRFSTTAIQTAAESAFAALQPEEIP
ncbi:hypothetical protein [Streptomyces uncialis]|uniref:hypothetical protein n=1 Tax=Streptomyces uncialis TaxID=1048205 RepID=UPI002256182C|nr:hypothetical protein [Streptomyces uncialis]MCX4664443.1 hypothetical protein [Streptomyces uncialis]